LVNAPQFVDGDNLNAERLRLPGKLPVT